MTDREELATELQKALTDYLDNFGSKEHGYHKDILAEMLWDNKAGIVAHLRAPAQPRPEPVAWRVTDGEGDYEYLTEEPSDQSRAWSRRYGREWEPLYASPVSSSPSEPAQLMWQPFETAPKDGTWIIARCNDHSRMFRISWGRAQNGDMCWCTSESIISYGDGLFSPNGGWTPCPISQLPSTELCCPGGCMFTPCKVSSTTRDTP